MAAVRHRHKARCSLQDAHVTNQAPSSLRYMSYQLKLLYINYGAESKE